MKFLILGIFSSLVLSSCQTKSHTTKPINDLASRTENRAQMIPKSASYKSPHQDFLETYADPQVEFNNEALKAFYNLDPTHKENSIEEAALTVGLLRAYHDSQYATHMQQKEIDFYAKQLNLDTQKALATNPILNSDDLLAFRNHLASATLAKTTPQQNPDESQASEQHNLPERTTYGEGVSQTSTLSGDALFKKAQELAASNKPAQAIETLGLIPTSHPLYNQAQQQAQSLQVEAIGEYKRKAVEAYKNAQPLNDPEARDNYLLEARAYLEQALEKFPTAPESQKNTLRKNLAVVNRSLNK